VSIANMFRNKRVSRLHSLLLISFLQIATYTIQSGNIQNEFQATDTFLACVQSTPFQLHGISLDRVLFNFKLFTTRERNMYETCLNFVFSCESRK